MSILKPRLNSLLRERYPDARYDTTEADCIVAFAGPAEMGDLEIWDEGTEVAVAIGRLTHVHITAYETLPYDPNISEEETADRVCAEVMRFLEDFFAGRIVVWTEPSTRTSSVGPVEAMPVPLPEGGEAFSWKGRLREPI